MKHNDWGSELSTNNYLFLSNADMGRVRGNQYAKALVEKAFKPNPSAVHLEKLNPVEQNWILGFLGFS